MKKVDELIKVCEDTKKFDESVDLFFRQAPSDPFWIFMVYYLSKKHCLEVINNYEGDEYVVAELPIDFINSIEIVKSLEKEGVKSVSVVAHLSPEERVYVENFAKRKSSFVYDDPRMQDPYFIIETPIKMMEMSQEWFEQNSLYAINKILKGIASRKYAPESIYYQPYELSQLMINLLGASTGRVYNPYAGVCSLAALLDNRLTYYGQELSGEIRLIAELLLKIFDKTNSVCQSENSFKDWKGANNFDYIISSPPFGIKVPTAKYTYDIDYFVRSSNDTKHKAIGVYPVAICSKGIRFEEIQRIVNADFLETVVLLPRNIFYTASIPSVMIVVNKKKTTMGMVRFVDASDCFTKCGRQNIIDVKTIESLCNRLEPNDKVAFSSIDKIKANGYNLFPVFYTTPAEIQVPEGMKLIKLESVLSQVLADNVTKDPTAVLRTKATNSIVSALQLEEEVLDEDNFKIIKTDSLVVSRFNIIAANYVKTEGKAVAISSFNNVAFSVRTSVVLPEYLVKEFAKDYFKDQVSRISFGNMWSAPSSADILNLQILIPEDLQKQRELAVSERELELEEIIRKNRKEAEKALADFTVNQRQRKHAVLQVLNDIAPGLDNIENFILTNESVTKDSVVSRRFGTTLQQYLSSIKVQLINVIKMVDQFTSHESYGTPENVELEPFFEEYCKSKMSNEKYRARYFYKHEDEEIYQEVRIARADLIQVLDNLFTNAVKYGFTDSNRRDYEIRIEMQAIHDDSKPVEIKISNNGVPVSNSISLEKLFAWGEGQGSGIGCWQVKDIVEHYGGTVSYNEYPEDPEGFVCEFCIKLPVA